MALVKCLRLRLPCAPPDRLSFRVRSAAALTESLVSEPELIGPARPAAAGPQRYAAVEDILLLASAGGLATGQSTGTAPFRAAAHRLHCRRFTTFLSWARGQLPPF